MFESIHYFIMKYQICYFIITKSILFRADPANSIFPIEPGVYVLLRPQWVVNTFLCNNWHVRIDGWPLKFRAGLHPADEVNKILTVCWSDLVTFKGRCTTKGSRPCHPRRQATYCYVNQREYHIYVSSSKNASFVCRGGMLCLVAISFFWG
jgi:hypothetical protein